MINRFESAKYTQEIVLDKNGAVIGAIRIKPSGVMWKPKGAGKFYSVPLKQFTDWITNPDTKAFRAKS